MITVYTYLQNVMLHFSNTSSQNKDDDDNDDVNEMIIML